MGFAYRMESPAMERTNVMKLLQRVFCGLLQDDLFQNAALYDDPSE